MGRINTTLALAALLPFIATSAQEAPAPEAAKQTPGPAPVAEQSPAAARTESRPSSRYHLGEVDSYIQGIATNFVMSKQPADPFGLMQDPDLKPITPKLITPRAKLKNIPATPFKDVVAAIQVTAVMPSQQQFLVASRTIRRGDKFPIIYRDKSVTVEVARVSGNSISFRNVKTRELADLQINALPPGMTRDAEGIAGPPGFERDNPSAPIEVDVTSLTPDAPPPRTRAALR